MIHLHTHIYVYIFIHTHNHLYIHIYIKIYIKYTRDKHDVVNKLYFNLKKKLLCGPKHLAAVGNIKAIFAESISQNRTGHKLGSYDTISPSSGKKGL